MGEAELEGFIRELVSIKEEILVHQLAISTLASVRKTIMCKLTENGVSQSEIADLLGVSSQKICQIVNRKLLILGDFLRDLHARSIESLKDTGAHVQLVNQLPVRGPGTGACRDAHRVVTDIVINPGDSPDGRQVNPEGFCQPVDIPVGDGLACAHPDCQLDPAFHSSPHVTVTLAVR